MLHLSVERERPDLRERASLHGVERLGDVELLALVLGTGTEGERALTVAARLLDEAQGVLGIARSGVPDLAARRGLGPAKATRVLAALELGRRAALGACYQRRQSVQSYEDVVAWARPHLTTLEHEEVWLLSLDGSNGLLSARRIAQGGTHGCALTPRDILRPAVRDGAAAVILLHNHPSGDPTPSAADVQMTRAACDACGVVGIDLLDHVVVARGGASSLRDLGALGMPKSRA